MGLGKTKRVTPGAATSPATVDVSTITSPGTITRRHVHFIANNKWYYVLLIGKKVRKKGTGDRMCGMVAALYLCMHIT